MAAGTVKAKVESIVNTGTGRIVAYEYKLQGDTKPRRSVQELEGDEGADLRLGQEHEIEEPAADNPG